MVIHSPNYLFEMLARIWYWLLNNYGEREPQLSVEYRQRRWYRRDARRQVVKIARTYFEVMQP